jgi:cobalt-zinc-cadmium efflux system membrane fusion protein
VNARLRFGLALGFTLISSVSCKGDRAHEGEGHGDDHGHDHGPASAAAGSPAGGGAKNPGTLRVDREMLRDLRITTAPAETRPAGDTVALLGELGVNEDAYAEVGSPIEARIVRVLVQPGDSIEARQNLAELESPEVGRARAAIASTRVRSELASRTLERRRALVADEIVPSRELEAAEAELAQAEAERRSAEQSLAALGAKSGGGARFFVSSPIAGTVIERKAVRGRMVSAAEPLFAVGELSRLWLLAHAFERDAVRIRSGSVARVSFPALPGQAFSGKVVRVGSRVDPRSRTIDVRLDVENREQLLRPGMSATALIPVGEGDQRVVAVPVAALQRLPHGWAVFLPQGEEGSFEVRSVGRGRDLAGEVEVLQGLRTGERVVVDGAFLLRAEFDKARGAGAEHDHH